MGGWRSVVVAVVVVVVVVVEGAPNRASDDDVTKQQSNSNTARQRAGSVGLIIIPETTSKSLSIWSLLGLVPLRGTY